MGPYDHVCMYVCMYIPEMNATLVTNFNRTRLLGTGRKGIVCLLTGGQKKGSNNQ